MLIISPTHLQPGTGQSSQPQWAEVSDVFFRAFSPTLALSGHSTDRGITGFLSGTGNDDLAGDEGFPRNGNLLDVHWQCFPLLADGQIYTRYCWGESSFVAGTGQREPSCLRLLRLCELFQAARSFHRQRSVSVTLFPSLPPVNMPRWLLHEAPTDDRGRGQEGGDVRDGSGLDHSTCIFGLEADVLQHISCWPQALEASPSGARRRTTRSFTRYSPAHILFHSKIEIS